jgi:hypothetical protein
MWKVHAIEIDSSVFAEVEAPTENDALEYCMDHPEIWQDNQDPKLREVKYEVEKLYDICAVEVQPEPPKRK